MSPHCTADQVKEQTMNPLLSTMSRYFRRSHRDRGRIRTSRRKARRSRLCLEALEDRSVPSTISIANASINEIGNVSAFVASGSGGLSQPKDLVMGPDGDVYVASAGTNSVIRYTSSGQLLGTFVTGGSGGLSDPRAVAFGPDGNLYVSSVTNNNILEYNGSTGAFLSTFVPAGSGGLNYPSGMVFGQDGNLYVSSAGTESVDRFQGPLGAAPGSPLPAAGQSGANFAASGSGGLAGPAELTFGPNGNLFVSNAAPAVSGVTNKNYGVLEFDAATGAFITTYVASNYVTVPRGLAFDQEGRLYVADWATNAIHRFDSQGNYLDDPVTSSASSLQVPIGMVFDAQGGLLVSSRDGNAVDRYDRGVTVTLSAASSTPVSVAYATADGTAIANTDYTPQSGTVTFAPGQTSRLVLLVTRYQSTMDGNDTFSVQLSNPSGATIGTGTATVTSVDPAWPQLSIANTSAIEGDTTAHYRGAFVQSPGNQFNPITFGPDGNLYTAVGTGPGYNTIERYNATTGAFMGTFASGPINGVRTIVFRGGYMYVASEYTNQVLQYNATTGAYVGVFVAAGSGGINGPWGMAFDSAGNLYVSGRNSNSVVKYDTNGNPVGTYIAAGSGGLNLPEGIAFDPSGTYLYAASSGTNQILKYNASTGAFVGVAASSGLSSPHYVVFGADGLMYVSSGGNSRIIRFTQNGTYVDDYVPAGSGSLADPHWMAFGANGDLYVGGTGSDDQIHQFGTENEALFNVSLSAAFAEPVTVNYATADGTAVAVTNYTATSGTLTFAPGVTTETIRVPILDSGSQPASLTFSVNLSGPQAATISQGQGTGTIAPSDQAAKFYVVNDATATLGGTNTDYKYQVSGTQQAPYGLNLSNLDPRGVASNAAGTKQWVVDANQNIYVYSPSGTLLGSWSAGGLSSNATLTGIATNGTDIWLVDSNADKVYKYTGAASRLSGSQSAASSFSLAKGKNGNANPQDFVTDGTSLWVVDGTALKVFKYNLTGSLLGSWSIDAANKNPTGITINPNNVSDIWIVDNGTDKVYQYIGAATRTSGSQTAAATFALNSNDTNPQGIADPPVSGELPLPAPSPFAALSTPPANAVAPSVLAPPLAAARRGELFRDVLAPVSQPFDVAGSGTSFSAAAAAGAPGAGNRSSTGPITNLPASQRLGDEPAYAGVLDQSGANDQVPTASAIDAFFSQGADQELVADPDER
jgi:sugar lactone lactonase YvrE